MGGFIMSVLVISALLSVIFGKRVGAMFATGVLGAAGVLVSVCIWLFVLVLYTNGFWSYHPKPDLPEYASTLPQANGYGAGYVPSQAPYYPPSTPTPTYQASGTPTYQASGTPTYQAAAPAATYQAAAPGTGPRLGIDIVELPADSTQILAYLHTPAGAGAWIRVHPGSPAEAAGLKSYDVILSAGTQTEQASWITLSNQLPNYLDRVGYNVPVRLHVYRATMPGDFWVWVHPR